MTVVKKLKGDTANPKQEERLQRRAAGRSLPERENVPPSTFHSYCSIIYGKKGVGKTSLAACFPRPMIFMLEPRRRNLRIRQIPQQGEESLTWETIHDYTDLCCDDRSVETVVYDTVDRLFQLCTDFYCRREGVKSPQAMRDHGALWSEIKQDFEGLFAQVLQAEKTLLLISHERVREFEDSEGQTYEQVTPSCSDSPWNTVKAMCDFAMYFGYDRASRTLAVRGTENVWAACGVEGRFQQPKSGEPLLYIPMGTTAGEGYKNLALAFDNKLTVPSKYLYPTDEPVDEEEPIRSKKIVRKLPTE